MKRKLYPSDLTDKQWAILAPLIPVAKTRGRPRCVNLREVLNAIFYILCGGCTWRMLPHDFRLCCKNLMRTNNHGSGSEVRIYVQVQKKRDDKRATLKE
jgi:hypothetical protein